jgi:hypothetical protein
MLDTKSVTPFLWLKMMNQANFSLYLYEKCCDLTSWRQWNDAEWGIIPKWLSNDSYFQVDEFL